MFDLTSLHQRLRLFIIVSMVEVKFLAVTDTFAKKIFSTPIKKKIRKKYFQKFTAGKAGWLTNPRVAEVRRVQRAQC